MTKPLEAPEAIQALGVWLVEHQVELKKQHDRWTALEHALRTLADRITLIEKNWE